MYKVNPTVYNTKYECRYHKDDIFLETDDISDNEKDYIRDILYKEDLINIFNIDNNDDFETLNQILSEINKKVKDYQPLQECMKKTASILLSENTEIGLFILYSYDYMYITHKCISEYLETGIISQENINLLNKCVNNC